MNEIGEQAEGKIANYRKEDIMQLEDILEQMYAECWCEEDLEETYNEIRSMSAVCLKRRAEEIGLDPDTVGY